MNYKALLLIIALSSCAVCEPLQISSADGTDFSNDATLLDETDIPNDLFDNGIKQNIELGSDVLESSNTGSSYQFSSSSNHTHPIESSNEGEFNDDASEDGLLDFSEDEGAVEFDNDNETDNDYEIGSRRLLATRTRLRRFPVKMTVDNEFDLYINGRKIGSGNSWTRTYSFNPSFRTVTTIAVDGRDRGGPAAFIGVFNGRPTRASDWKCKNFNGALPKNWMKPNFNDKSWSKARSYGRNNQNTVWRRVSRRSRPSIPSNAEWIWTSNNNNHNRVVCRMTLVKPKVVKPKVAPKSNPTIRKGYSKITAYLNSIEKEIKNDIKKSTQMNKGANAKLNEYNSKALEMQRTLTRTRIQLDNAKKQNTLYVKKYNTVKSNENSLLASLRRQRSFISVEHAYINKMEREALSLKRTSPQYKEIQKEIIQMRTQMKKEISDIEAAYARALKTSKTNKDKYLKKRNALNANIARFNRVITSYTVKHREFLALMSRIHKTEGINVFLIKALNNLNRASADFNTHVQLMSKQNIIPNFRLGYSQCIKETNTIKNFYRRAKCTKM